MPHSKKVKLRNGLELTQLGIGTAPLGGLFSSVADEDAQLVVDSAMKAGVGFFDTAPHYGKGVAERRLGGALSKYPRESFVISTKVGRLLVPASEAGDADFADADRSVDRVFDFSARGVRQSLEESLDRLGLHSVDILFIHDPDNHADEAISQAFPELAKMRDEGLIKAIGIGMNFNEIPTRFVKETDIDLVLIAGRYTLLDQSAANELFPAALERGVGIIAAGVFNSGILANPVKGAHYFYAPAPEEVLQRALQLEAILEEYEVSLEQAAIQFPLQHPAVKSVLVGCRSHAEVVTNIENFDTPIPQSAWEAVHEFIASQQS